MTTDGVPRPLNWKELYQLAMLEMDPAKVPSAITKANDAILDTIERIDRNAFGHELSALNDALNGLRRSRSRTGYIQSQQIRRYAQNVGGCLVIVCLRP